MEQELSFTPKPIFPSFQAPEGPVVLTTWKNRFFPPPPHPHPPPPPPHPTPSPARPIALHVGWRFFSYKKPLNAGSFRTPSPGSPSPFFLLAPGFTLDLLFNRAASITPLFQRPTPTREPLTTACNLGSTRLFFHFFAGPYGPPFPRGNSVDQLHARSFIELLLPVPTSPSPLSNVSHPPK